MMAKQSLKRPLLYISAAIILLALFWGAKDKIDWYNQNLSYLQSDLPSDVNTDAVQRIVDLFSGYDVFINGIGFGNSGFYPVLVMLCVGFLFTGNFAKRLSDGSGITEIVRIGYKRYYKKEVIKNFISSFLFVAIILSCFLILCLCLYSGKLPTKGYASSITTATDLFYRFPLLYCIIQILNQACFLGLFSVMAMSTASFYTNTFVNRVSPLILYLFLTVVAQLLYNFTKIPWFILMFPDLIFVPFNIEGGTLLGFVGEKICAYLILLAVTACFQLYAYRKYRCNYLK